MEWQESWIEKQGGNLSCLELFDHWAPFIFIIQLVLLKILYFVQYLGLSEEPVLHICFFLPCVMNEYNQYSIFSIIGVQTRLLSSVSLQLHKSNLAAIMVVPGPLVVP